MNPIRGLLPLAGLLLVWQLAGDEQSVTLPPPSEWFAALARLNDAGELLPAIATTMSTYLVALAIAVLVGGFLGVLIGASRRADRLLTPALDVVATVPGAALIPLTLLLLGITFLANVAIVALAVDVAGPAQHHVRDAVDPGRAAGHGANAGPVRRRALAQGHPALVGARRPGRGSGSPRRCR